ncbi:hypothetical protein [Chitinophaga niabensis]|uniref:Outer membrane insertion C-terminal signal n=1 Tax=Chitinophaga niabensis TaxID=536979 RepID=A0A1N6FGQ7_9BACT|nr:hypothetical protein [Chitinophaga niabensis]SIN94449.1 hypothetical protein SAMN04488055_2212 [Chitinophaga niabensis]
MRMLTTLFLFTCIAAQAQDSTAKKLRFSLEGMIGVSFGNSLTAINVGGPHLKLKVGEQWSVGICALPSLFIHEGKPEPKLGLGFRVDYRRFVFLVPGYYLSNQSRWLWSYGIGYKFH